MSRPFSLAPRRPDQPRAGGFGQRIKPFMLDRLASESRSQNNFDLLRLVGALLVLFAHSFDLLYQPEPFPHLAGLSWGTLGVLIFFSISGFLVSRSWDYSPRLGGFAAKRALRLMPGLFVALLLTALVLGPLVTTTTTGAYLNDPATKTYILSNLSLQSDWQLPGVFVHNVYPVAVNGSLWTLPLEVKSYVILAVLGLVAVRLRRRGLMTIAAVLAVLVAINGVRPAVPGGNDFVAALAQIQVTSATAADAARGSFTIYALLFASFAIGGALYELRRFVPVLWPLALLLVVLLIVAGLIGGNAPAYGFMIATPYLVLCVAYRTRSFVRLPRWMGDYSYGLYIYAFPIQQTLSQLLVPVSAWVLFLLAVPITAGLAILSWHFVERPALNLKPAPSEPVPVLSGIADVLAMPADAVPVDTAEPVQTSVSS